MSFNIEGRVTKAQHREGTLDNGDRWAHEAVTVLVDEEELVTVKFPDGNQHGLAKGDQVSMSVDIYRPKCKFVSHTVTPVKSGVDGKRLASA